MFNRITELHQCSSAGCNALSVRLMDYGTECSGWHEERDILYWITPAPSSGKQMLLTELLRQFHRSTVYSGKYALY